MRVQHPNQHSHNVSFVQIDVQGWVEGYAEGDKHEKRLYHTGEGKYFYALILWLV